jgi:hypothetical protein
MKGFFNNYSYSAVKMFVNQFAISIFGSMLSMATTAANNDTVSIVVSCFSVVFYLFLIYTMTWEIGAKDRISVDVQKKEYRPHTGLAISAVANLPNLLIAIVYLIGYPFASTNSFAGTVCSAVRIISLLLEGMYLGITTSVYVAPEVTLNFLPITYFVMIIPALLTSWISYYFGFKNKKFTTLFDYQDPNKSKRK